MEQLPRSGIDKYLGTLIGDDGKKKTFLQELELDDILACQNFNRLLWTGQK